MSEAKNAYGLMAEFETPAEILRAAAMIRDAGYLHWDVFTPFPVHGMNHAMGLKGSRVGWFSFIGGVLGYWSGMLMIWYMNAHDYAIPVGGKPMFSPFFSFPPSFELTILLGAFGALFGMLYTNQLPRLYHPLLKNPRFKRVTHDGFFIVIEAGDPKYSEAEARRLLESAGSRHIEQVEE
ncbi:MAG: DUF3341 domain-containing protein [Candidatus Omnitrophica bacterium]|nr:DUF3341 domain-containing protein [Candidatus Omnitrophota bacterium]